MGWAERDVAVSHDGEARSAKGAEEDASTPADGVLAVDLSGTAPAASAAVPDAYALHGAVPNPSAGRTEIRYDLPERARVSLTVYDVLGRAVAGLVGGARRAGAHREPLDTGALPAGVYVVRLDAVGEGARFAASARLTVLE